MILPSFAEEQIVQALSAWPIRNKELGGRDMVGRHLLFVTLALAATLCMARAQSPNGVKTLDPPGAIKVEGTWSLGARPGFGAVRLIRRAP